MRERRNQAGFTLIEIMVVLLILGFLAAMVGPQLIGRADKAAAQAARLQVENFGTALDMFRLDVGRYPTTQEGLEALRRPVQGNQRWDGPYVKKAIPLDPWQNAYLYRSPGQNGRPYDLVSYGQDGQPGGNDDGRDITSWED